MGFLCKSRKGKVKSGYVRDTLYTCIENFPRIDENK